jgi:hypothetical protein
MPLGAVPGARCARHPEVSAIGVCDRCGSFYCDACKGRMEEGRTYCVACGAAISYVAWEDRARLGTMRAFFLTLKRAVLAPQEFPREIPADGGFGAPTGFAAIATTIGMGFTCLFFGLVLTIVFAALRSGPEPSPVPAWLIPVLAVFYWIVGVIGEIVMLYLGAGILRLSSRMFGAPAGSYDGIFRVLAYSAGLNVAMGIPGLSTVALVLQVLHAIFGISAKCGVSNGRAAAIFFTPVAICLCALGSAYVLLIFAVARLAAAPV